MKAYGRAVSDKIKRSEHATVPLGVAADVVAILQFVGTCAITLLGVGKVAGSLPPLSLPMRLLFIVTLSGALGAILGVTLHYLSMRPSKIVAAVGYFTAIVWGAILIVVVDTLTPPQGDGTLLQFTMFLTVSLGIFLGVLTFALGAWTGGVDVRASRERAITVFVVTATTIAAGILIQVGALT